ncbi:hypothetical protein EUGRSUZ_C03273 [Eucalyptus grandis]|uniref:Uncharacterized protein n=2 Tax=Eucalyptus grandis TaxID=71139 RepID=A0ACC3LIN6_EUCGR|nr:hypothetical protein EUGRSUZ_C03273 [Eucalyptus grandis]
MVEAVGVPIEVVYLGYSSAVDKIAVFPLPLWINRPTGLRCSVQPILRDRYREQCTSCRLTLSAELGSTSGKDCYTQASASIDFLLECI